MAVRDVLFADSGFRPGRVHLGRGEADLVRRVDHPPPFLQPRFGREGTSQRLHFQTASRQPSKRYRGAVIRPELCVVIRPITRKIFVRERLL